MLKGVHLTLMIGPGLPSPVPQGVLDALSDVKVITTSGESSSGFELTFTLSHRFDGSFLPDTGVGYENL